MPQRVAHLNNVITVQYLPILFSVHKPSVRVPYFSRYLFESRFPLCLAIVTPVRMMKITSNAALTTENTELVKLTREVALSYEE
jgi:hypothetical protein